MNTLNTAVDYQYRDGANWKTGKRIVLAGELTGETIAMVFASTFDDAESFLPAQVGLPSLLGLLGDGTITEDDHPWHELLTLEPTTDPVSFGYVDLTAADWADQFNGVTWDEDAATEDMESLR